MEMSLSEIKRKAKKLTKFYFLSIISFEFVYHLPTRKLKEKKKTKLRKSLKMEIIVDTLPLPNRKIIVIICLKVKNKQILKKS